MFVLQVTRARGERLGPIGVVLQVQSLVPGQRGLAFALAQLAQCRHDLLGEHAQPWGQLILFFKLRDLPAERVAFREEHGVALAVGSAAQTRRGQEL